MINETISRASVNEGDMEVPMEQLAETGSIRFRDSRRPRQISKLLTCYIGCYMTKPFVWNKVHMFFWAC